MKASIKFRDEQKPLVRAKIPLNIINFPLQAGITAGESKESSLSLSSFFDFGPSFKLSYRPKDPQNPYGVIVKTGIGQFGSPIESPLSMSAEFNLVGNNQNPRFLIHFKPEVGNFSLKRSLSSGGFAKEKINGGVFSGVDNFVNNGYLKGNAFFPAAVEVLKSTELSARTELPVRDSMAVNFRWGLRVPTRDAAEDELDAVVVRKGGDRMAGIGMPFLVMNKVGIEYVARDKSKKEKAAPRSGADVAGACLEVKKQLEAIQAENGLMSKALGDLRSDIAAGKMDFLRNNNTKYSNGGGDKKSLEAKGSGFKGAS